VIPLETASETGEAHPESLGLLRDLWGMDFRLLNLSGLILLECRAIEGESPVNLGRRGKLAKCSRVGYLGNDA